MNNKTTQAIKISALAILLSLGIGYALAWTAPTATPPTGNVSAPINTSATAQIKAGPLTLGGLTLTGATSKITFSNGSTMEAAPPTIKVLTATPSTIQSGQTATINWDVAGATTCTASNNWSGAKVVPSGNETTAPITGPASSQYTLTCTGAGGTVSQTAFVTVLAPFIQTFSNGQAGTVAIPAGVTKLTFSGAGGAGGAGYSGFSGGEGGTMGLSGPEGKGAPSYMGSGVGSNGVGASGGTGGSGGGVGGFEYSNGAAGKCVGATIITAAGFGGGGAGGNGYGYNVGGSASGGGGGGGSKVSYPTELNYPFLSLGGGGGGGSSYYGAGGAGGGGFGGGGSGISAECTTNFLGGGGGGGGIISPLFSAPVGNSRSILVSQITGGPAAPINIYIKTSAGGLGNTGRAGGGGTMTVSW